MLGKHFKELKNSLRTNGIFSIRHICGYLQSFWLNGCRGDSSGTMTNMQEIPGQLRCFSARPLHLGAGPYKAHDGLIQPQLWIAFEKIQLAKDPSWPGVGLDLPSRHLPAPAQGFPDPWLTDNHDTTFQIEAGTDLSFVCHPDPLYCSDCLCPTSGPQTSETP